MRRKLAAGNWKMNGLGPALAEIADLRANHPAPTVDLLICPPATLLSRMAQVAAGTAMSLGGQTCHPADSGAHTGEISASMLADAGASYVILGHSERRADQGETDTDIRVRVTAALSAGLTPVVCVGETLAQREAGKTLAVVTDQLTGSLPDDTPGLTVVAYEPVWAIGTGKVPTLDQIAEVHTALRKALTDRFGTTGDEMRLLYGGSVKPGNAAEIFSVPDVDGALVGGASLTAQDFSPIIAALETA
ncbi:MAG: triose-phosphate isomerase [Rhodobacteraceae bacterium]|nr:triose-phosphate isomerase [Paracoccaceae bacterium]